MKKTMLLPAAAAAVSALLCLSTGAQAGDYWDWKLEFQQIVAGGKVSFDARYRFESVDEDGRFFMGKPVRAASASTIRTRLGYLTGPYKGLQAFLELEDVSAVGTDEYDSRVPGNKFFN